MHDQLIKIHEDVNRCRRCIGILDESRIIPRSGFPPTGMYTAMIIGCEPGQSAKDRLTPEEYRQRFLDSSIPNNRNTVRRLFKAVHKAGVDWYNLFYTNAVKCPATPREATCCYAQCQSFLNEQIKAVDPRVIVVFGRGAERIGVLKARKNDIRECTFQGRPCIVVTHPQGSTSAYLAKVGQHVRNKIFAK